MKHNNDANKAGVRPVWLQLFAAVFFFILSCATVNANPYNEGFIAAESGDYKSAVQYWMPLAKRGDALAQFNVALLYHSGLGVEQNESKAVNWYHKAADNGYYIAQEYLAVGYQEGWFGLPKNHQKAQYWLQRLESGK
jgi:TPR repeat protein